MSSVLGAAGARCDLLADGEVLGRSAELVAEVEALSEVVEALGKLPALDGVEGEVAAASVILSNVRREFMHTKVYRRNSLRRSHGWDRGSGG